MSDASPEEEPLELAWWLDGEHVCEQCWQQYSLEISYRCADCDQLLCPMCAVTIRETKLTICPDCNRERDSA